MRWDQAEVGDTLICDPDVDEVVYLAVEIGEGYVKWLNLMTGLIVATKRGADRIMDYTLVKREL